ncbi:T9SS type A sorting domain-containing protein [Adhaeribacter radiodurans]|uniref:T9SS type A sorting domain-containing protein n=1 Tax=Adhaeribacter radiodurans TaxID=2745197 RepID=A0A7L7LDZ1_9BACT|nr:T9SS type A sorting domain-containing protein [Adhaeribacter radiodurans]QMU31048.1 T9SS type A sorting domain-containing protein [Adhaeribacter radiodurans]
MKILINLSLKVQLTRTLAFHKRSIWLIFLLHLSLPLVSFAQIKTWDKTFGGNSYDFLTSVVNTSDGGYLLGGTSNSNKSGDKSETGRGPKGNRYQDYWIVKTDNKGKKMWEKTFGGENYDFLKAVVATPDGGYLLGGFSSSGKSEDKSEANKSKESYYSDYWLVKIDANGKKEWDKTYGGDGDDELYAMVAAPDGGYLLAGPSGSDKSDDKSEDNKGGKDQHGNISSDYWIVKIKADGTKVWDKTIGGKLDDRLTSLLVTADKGYLLSGYSISEKSGDKSENKLGNWVVKLDVEGKKIWDKTFSYGGDVSDWAYNKVSALLNTPDGGYLVGTNAPSGKKEDKSTSYAGYWIIKIDSQGKKQWDKTYGGSFRDEFRTMITSPDGGYLLSGISNRKKAGDKSDDKKGYWIVKIKENGTKEWDRTYGSVNNHNLGEEPSLKALVPTSDGGFLVGGNSSLGVDGDKTEESRGEYDYWVVKIALTKKKEQIITFPTPLITKTLGDAPITLSAKTSSGLPVTFSLVSGPGTLKGKILAFTNLGTIKVKASQAGNATYAAATDVFQTIIVDVPTPVTKVWDRTIAGEFNDLMVATPDGGFIMGNSSRLTKINKEGTKIQDINITFDFWLGSLLITSDGGYLLGGTPPFGVGAGYSIVKLNSNGTTEWEKDFKSDWSTTVFSTMVPTQDGGYLLGGYSESGIYGDKSEPSRGSSDYWIIKIDSKGNKIWDKTLGGNEWDNLTAMLATPDGGFVLGGSSNSDKSNDKSETYRGDFGENQAVPSDYWIVKIDAAGNKQWDKTYGGNNRDDLSVIVASPNGGYLLGGTSYSDKSSDKSESSRDSPNSYKGDYWVIKIDAIGKKLWDKTIGGNQEDYLRAIVPTEDGNYLLGGSSTSGVGEDKSGQYRGGNSFGQDGDYWIVKVDNTGKKMWDENFGTSRRDDFTALQVSTDGSYLLSGTSNAGIDGDKTEFSRDPDSMQGMNQDYWLIKIKEDLSLTAQWDLRYGGSGNEGFTTIIKTSDGGYLSGGYSASGVSGDRTQASQGKNDYWIVKSDANGKKLWDKRYGGSADDYLNRIIQTKDGGYLLAGSSLSGKGGDKSEASRGGRDYWIDKLDKQGKKEWDKSYGGSGYDELKKVLQLSTGEYLLAGYSNSPVSGEKTQASQGENDYWLVKVSSTGEKLWDKRYGGNLEEELAGIVQTAEGGFLLGGSSWSDKSGNKTGASRGKSDFWLVAVDKEGKQLWDRTYGGKGEDQAYSLGKAGNTYFLAGQSDSPAGWDKTRDSQGGLDYWLLKVSSTGEKVWDKRYGGSKDDELRASIPTQDSGYLLAGKSFSNQSGNKRQDSQGLSDYWMVKADKDGQYEWSKTFGGSGAEELRAVIQTSEGGYLLGGKSYSGVSGDRTQPSQGGYDYWLVKVAPEAKSIVAEREATLVEEIPLPMEQFSLKAYPNPSSGKFTVSFTLPQTQNASLKVYDNQGREITTLFQGEAKANQKYEVEWQANNKAAGLFFLQLQNPTLRWHQKLLIAK